MKMSFFSKQSCVARVAAALLAAAFSMNAAATDLDVPDGPVATLTTWCTWG